MIEHDNIFYIENISPLGGVETFVYELAKKYQDYDIAVVCKQIAPNQYGRLSKICPVYVHTHQKIKCKTIITNYDTSILDYTEAECICETIHADYTNPHYTVYPKIDKRVNHWLGITKHVCETFKNKFKVETELCYNPLEIEESEKELILVSATRLSPIKGANRMTALKRELDNRGIKYKWFIFSNENIIKGDNVVYMKPTIDIRNWIKQADYVVQLSDSEACSYTINESLVMGTPVIVTPLPYLEELGIKDGINCYILNFDLSNLSEVVDKIKDIPKFKFELPKDNYDKYVVKNTKSKYKEMLKMKFLVEATDKYERERIIDNGLTAEKGEICIPKKGEQWIVGLERKNILESKGFVKVIEEISDSKATKEPKDDKFITEDAPEEEKKPVKKAKKTK